MINSRIVNSVTSYLLKKDVSGKKDYEIYNEWATKFGVIISEPDSVIWLINYINDIRNMDASLLKQ